MGKIRAIVKRPDEKYGHVCNISATLKNLQKNGYECAIETHTEYMPQRVCVSAKVKEYEVEEGV